MRAMRDSGATMGATVGATMGATQDPDKSTLAAGFGVEIECDYFDCRRHDGV